MFCTTLVFGSSTISLGCQNYKNREVIYEYQKQNAVLEKIIEDEEEVIALQNEEMKILETKLSEAEKKIAEQEQTIKKQQAQITKDKQQINTQMNREKTFVGTFNLSFYSKEQFPNSKTCTGAMPQVGTTVAVDPKVIPLGSKIYIEGLGVRIAQDTGGAIKGNKLDVFVATTAEAYQLGRQNRKVWIVK